MKKNRLIEPEYAKEQRQVSKARDKVQCLLRKTESVLNNAQGLIKQAKLANQKAQAPLEEVKNR